VCYLHLIFIHPYVHWNTFLICTYWTRIMNASVKVHYMYLKVWAFCYSSL